MSNNRTNVNAKISVAADGMELPHNRAELGDKPRPSGRIGLHEEHGLAELKSGGDLIRKNEKTQLVVYNPRIPISDLLAADKLLIRRSWRSLPLHWLIMPILAYAAIELSQVFPDSVLHFSFDIASVSVQLYFPLFVIPLFLVMVHAFEKIYNRHIILDPEYLVYYRGNHSINREICDMETSSMQVVSVKQKPWEALMGVGNVALGRFSRKGMEFDLYGVANPYRLARVLKLSVLRARKNEGKLSDSLQNSDEDEDDVEGNSHY